VVVGLRGWGFFFWFLLVLPKSGRWVGLVSGGGGGPGVFCWGVWGFFGGSHTKKKHHKNKKKPPNTQKHTTTKHPVVGGWGLWLETQKKNAEDGPSQRKRFQDRGREKEKVPPGKGAKTKNKFYRRKKNFWAKGRPGEGSPL